MRQIVRGVWAIEGLKMGRSYLIEDKDGLTLIDSSSPGAADGIARAIEGVGRRVDELRTIVVTHYHFDHTGNAGALRERSGAQVLAHAADLPYIDGSTPWGTGRPPSAWEQLGDRMMAPKPFALAIDREIRDGDVLPVAGGLRVLHAPGHTPGHIALLATEKRVLFAGDSFMNILGLRTPAGGSTHDMTVAKATIRKLAGLDFDHALPGHGSPVLNHASEKLQMWSNRWL